MTPRRPYLQMDASLSDDGVYRYWLSRRLSMGERAVVFVGLNPSTADATQDDQTIRREVDYARRWGFDLYWKGNLYAYRSTDPAHLRPLDDLTAVGPLNQESLRWLAQKAEIIVCAWGGEPLKPSAQRLAQQLQLQPNARYLQLNADGTPSHPLYLKKTLTPLSWAASLGGEP